MWLAVGVILFLSLATGWRLIPAIVAFGIGLLFLRGAVSTVLRRERRSSK
jgi:ABC-type siderophore export system fused ATPase/permease subunit